jgi:hypothetical protein
VGLGVVAAALALGCVVQSEPQGGYGGSSGDTGPSTGTGSSSGGSGTPSSQPMLVDVDPNKTMSASPGKGVGVFVEYGSGGHWNIWWICSATCDYDNVVTVSNGTITNVAGQQLEASDSVTQDSPQKIEAITTTTTGVDGITFDTPFSSGQTPVITLTVKLNGVESAQFACQNSTGEMCNLMYFVQDGQIDGNYQGMLTDPLMLEPSSP